MPEYFTLFIDEHRDLPKEQLLPMFRAYPIELRWDIYTALMARDKLGHPQDRTERAMIADLTFDICQPYSFLERLFGEYLYGVEKPRPIIGYEDVPQFGDIAAKVEIRFDNTLLQDLKGNKYVAWCNKKVAITHHLKKKESFEV